MSATGHWSGGLPFRAVVAVASRGGLSSVSRLLTALPAAFEVPLLLVQHHAPTARADGYVQLLQRHSTLPVRLAHPGRPVATGVTVVPPGALVTLDDRLSVHMANSRNAMDRSHAGDVLFSSAAAHLGRALIGVVLTGNLDDGTEGARSIKSAGGRVLAEDPRVACAPSMPTSAIATGCVDHILPVTGIAAALVAFTMAVGAAELFAVPTPSWAQLSI